MGPEKFAERRDQCRRLALWGFRQRKWLKQIKLIYLSSAPAESYREGNETGSNNCSPENGKQNTSLGPY